MHTVQLRHQSKWQQADSSRHWAYLFKFGLWNSADAVCAKISILFLNASQAAHVLIARFLPLCNQVFVGNVFTKAVFIQLCTRQQHRLTSTVLINLTCISHYNITNSHHHTCNIICLKYKIHITFSGVTKAGGADRAGWHHLGVTPEWNKIFLRLNLKEHWTNDVRLEGGSCD